MMPFEPGEMAIYFNGQRIGTAENVSYELAEEAPPALVSFDLTPREFKIEVKFSAEDSEKLMAVIRRKCGPTRATRKAIARYRQDCRRRLVRAAGRVPIVRERMGERERMICEALGVGVPRSLRQDRLRWLLESK